MNLFSFFYVMYGILFIVSLLLIFEKIGPNGIVGYRICKALSNENNWYRVNKFGGWCLLISSIIVFIYLIVLQLSKKYISSDLYIKPLGAIGVTIITLVGAAIIPITYSFLLPEDNTTSEDKNNITGMFMTDYSVVVYVFLCLISIFLAAPLAFNKVEPNSMYGFRISKTFSSEAIWYEANQFSGWAIIIASCVTLLFLLFLKIMSKTNTLFNHGIVYLMVYLIPIVISILVSFLYVVNL